MLGLVLIILPSEIRAMKFDCNHEFFYHFVYIIYLLFCGFFKESQEINLVVFTADEIIIYFEWYCNHRQARIHIYSEKKYFLHCRSGQISSYLV